MIKDISHWEKDETIGASGTREKFWLIHPNIEEQFLFKLPKEGTGEIWAEKISSDIGKLLEYDMMDTSIAIYHNRQGILMKKFTKGKNEEFFDGGDLLKTVVEDFDPEDLHGYTLENICRCLQPIGLVENFISMIVFDALIGNQDRHCENWGIIQTRDTIRLTPFFDNGSSLGFNKTEGRMDKMFKDERMFKAFTNKARSLIGVEKIKKPRVKVLLSQLQKLFPTIFKNELLRLESLQEAAVVHILETIENEAMSDIQKKWVLKLVMYRKKWLLDLLKGETDHV